MRKTERSEILSRGKRLSYRMDASKLNSGELSYLFGLYFADGCLYKKRKTSKVPTGMNWDLQGDEEELAMRVVALLRKASLNPYVRFSKVWNQITVAINAVNLSEVFPVKADLLQPSVAWKFLENRKLTSLKLGIPFIAGLIDGDGACQVNYRLRRRAAGGLGSIESQWSFGQNKFPCLCGYLHRYVQSLCPGGSAYSTYHRRNKNKLREEHVVYILKSGVDALLEGGIGHYSWKVEKWRQRFTELQNRLSLLRSNVRTVGQAARSLDLNKFTVWSWCKKGWVKTLQGGKRAWYLISSDEVERLRESRTAYTTGRAAQKLGRSVATISRWCRAGKIRTLWGDKRRKYLIPVGEVERLFQEFGRK